MLELKRALLRSILPSAAARVIAGPVLAFGQPAVAMQPQRLPHGQFHLPQAPLLHKTTRTGTTTVSGSNITSGTSRKNMPIETG